MKTLLVVLSFFVWLPSFEQKASQFIVRGKFKDAPNSKLHLQLIPFQRPAKDIDSTYTTADGTYQFKAAAIEQQLFLIGPKGGHQAIFTNDSKQIIINLSDSNYRFPKVSGSAGTKEIYGFLAATANYNALYEKIDKQLDSLELLDNVQAEIEVLKKEEALVGKRNRAFVEALVESSNSPAAIYYIIFQSEGSPGRLSKAAILRWMGRVKKKFKLHSGLLQLVAETKKEIERKPEPYALQGKDAPELVMPTADGKLVSVSSFHGKYLLIDFWASWCVPCREENPNVVGAYNSYKDKNFEILGVSLDKDKQRWVKAIEKDSLTWPQMSDLKFWDSEAVGKYHFNGIPFNVLIDPSGKIIANSLRGEKLLMKLAEIIK